MSNNMQSDCAQSSFVTVKKQKQPPPHPKIYVIQ